MKTWYKKSMWCGPEQGCSRCRVCKYQNFLEWAYGCAPEGSTIQRDKFIDDFLSLVGKYSDGGVPRCSHCKQVGGHDRYCVNINY